MKVYRYLSETELNNILSGKTEELGNFFTHKRIIQKKYGSKVNNHSYNPKEKYLHFFKNLSDIEHIRQERRFYEENYYFAEFEVPALVLFFAAGRGYYNTLHGYDTYIESIKEYAVMAKYFNPNWLVGYALDQNKQVFMHENAYNNLTFNSPLEKNK